MQQIDEDTRIYYEGEHIIQKGIKVAKNIENEFGENIECPYGYRLVTAQVQNNFLDCVEYFCLFVSEVPVKCKLISNRIKSGGFKFGYFSPGEVIKENSLRKKY